MVNLDVSTCTSDPSFTGAKTNDVGVNTDKDVYYTDPSGVLIKAGYNSYYNETTKTWTNAQAQAYIAANTEIAALMFTPPTGTTSYLQSVPAIKDQESKDIQLVGIIRNEYCFYKVRYEAYLGAFLNAIKPSPENPTLAADYLEVVKNLNNKLNALVLLVNYIKEQRAGFVNANTSAFNSLNAELLTEMQNLGPSSALINSNQFVLNTRKEMVKYTKEKNNAITNQISLWASLNIVAIAMIFHIYRSM
jgi:hypothetical protein